jgi:hypothetical protein
MALPCSPIFHKDNHLPHTTEKDMFQMLSSRLHKTKSCMIHCFWSMKHQEIIDIVCKHQKIDKLLCLSLTYFFALLWVTIKLHEHFIHSICPSPVASILLHNWVAVGDSIVIPACLFLYVKHCSHCHHLFSSLLWSTHVALKRSGLLGMGSNLERPDQLYQDVSHAIGPMHRLDNRGGQNRARHPMRNQPRLDTKWCISEIWSNILQALQINTQMKVSLLCHKEIDITRYNLSN